MAAMAKTQAEIDAAIAKIAGLAAIQAARIAHDKAQKDQTRCVDILDKNVGKGGGK